MELGFIIGSIFVMLGLGAIFGAGLAVASAKLKVDRDPRIDELMDLLPGVNCGACGLSGCEAMAKALLAGNAEPSECALIPPDVAERVAEVAGTDVGQRQKRVAVVLCRAKDVGRRHDYSGLSDCSAAALLQGGPTDCVYACIGLGTCADVCPFEAITMGEDELPRVDPEKCVACGKCVQVCPRNIISLLSVEKYVHVLCSSHDKGGQVRKLCEAGCIACKLCEKACEFDAIKVEDCIAKIDYEKCTLCGKCVEACPRGIIRDIRIDQHWPKATDEVTAAEVKSGE